MLRNTKPLVLAALTVAFFSNLASAQSETDKMLLAKNRRLVEQMYLSASRCRTTITEMYQSLRPGKQPSPNGWGCETDGKTFAVRTSADGVIYLMASRDIMNDDIGGRVLTLAPTYAGQAVRWNDKSPNIESWRCGNPRDLPKGAKMIAQIYIPEKCKP